MFTKHKLHALCILTLLLVPVSAAFSADDATVAAPKAPNSCVLDAYRATDGEEGILVKCHGETNGTLVVERSLVDGPWAAVGTMKRHPDYVMSFFEDFGVESGHDYFYRVYAQNEAGRTDAVVPTQPYIWFYDNRGPQAGTTSLEVFHQYRNEVALYWSPSGNPATIDGFLIERTIDSQNAWTTVARVPKSQTHYRDYSALGDEVHYKYRIRGYNAYGLSLDNYDGIIGANVALPERRPPPFSNSTRFDIDAGIVNIPCLRLLKNGQYADYYKASLLHEGGRLRVTHSETLAAQPDCTGVFDVDHGTYRDTAVRYGDKVYSVRLQRQADNRFTIENATFQREGLTSLWKVSNGDKVLYLGGTPPYLHQSEATLPAAFVGALAAADVYVQETEPLWYEKTYSGFYLEHPNRNYLSTVLTPATLTGLDQAMRWLFIEPRRAAVLKPQWIQEWALGHIATRAGFGSGADDRLWLYPARKSRSETLGTLATTSTPRDVPLAETETFLRRLLERIRSGEYVIELEEFAQHWRDGDRAGLLLHLRQHGLDTDSAEYRQIVAERDAQWLPRLIAYLETAETELVVVDALHLAGPGNLLERLEAKGYTVTQQ